MPPSEAAPGAHGLEAAVAHGLAVFGAQGFVAGALAAQGLATLQGLAFCGTHGFTAALGAQG